MSRQFQISDRERTAVPEQLIHTFEEQFGADGDVRCYFAPGRVNLIGEHTDYNGGHVFPCVLTIRTYALIRRRDDKRLRFYSANFSRLGIREGALDHLVYTKNAGWANYPIGMVWAFGEKGFPIDTGFDLLIGGNIPNASGLSSSSSLEVAVGIALCDLYGFEQMTMEEITLIGQYAENHFNGVNCRIMDQFSIAMGKKDHAIFLDCGDLLFSYVPIMLKEAKLIVTCSNKKRGRGDSKYNERHAECEQALKMLQNKCDIRALEDLTAEEFEAYKDEITSEVLQRRARHAVYENQRTIQAVQILQNGDIGAFGRLMNESHISLRNDYEVTGRELDTLVETAWEQLGVIGSRMTGTGFGGCTVSIVRDDCVEDFIRNVGSVYLEKIGYEADFFPVSVGDGARAL